MAVCRQFQYYKNMINFKLFFCILLIGVFVSGCTDTNDSPFVFLTNLPSHKINHVIDLNGDKKSEFIFWNTSTMSGKDKFLEQCFFETINIAANKYSTFKFGEPGDIPFVGYFDDDGVIDYGTYRSYTMGASDWFVQSGANPSNRFGLQLGESGDIPVPSDFDGDEKADFTVYKSMDSTFEGILSRTGAKFRIQLGSGGDIPVIKDYDGDGRADVATYKPRTGAWSVKLTRDNSVIEKILGGQSYLPIPSDYDGDGKADFCAINIIDKSVIVEFSGLLHGISPEIATKIKNELSGKDFVPVPSDYNGDGSSELAFWSNDFKILITFDIREKLKKKVYHFPKVSNSLPVNNFLLIRQFIRRYYGNSSVSYNHGPSLVLFNDDEFIDYGNPMKFVPGTFGSKPSILSSFISQGYKRIFKFDKKQNVIPFVLDIDGDYVLEPCLWSKDTGTFYCNSSRVGWKFALQTGQKNDIPLTGNFNGDNITDLGVYRASTHTFYIRYLGKYSPQNTEVVKLSDEAGSKGLPQIADYDNDGIDDLSVYNPSDNSFLVRKSSDLQEAKISFCTEENCNKSNIIPINGDFDGDGNKEPGEVDLTSNTFTYFSSLLGRLIKGSFAKKINNYIFSADLDQDFKSDLVFVDPLNGVINICDSVNGFKYGQIKFTNKGTKKLQLVNSPWLYNEGSKL